MSREENNLIAGLDIGSSSVRIAVGNIIERDGEPSILQILGAAEAPSEGVNKGVITSIEDVVSAISSCLEQAERMVGVPLDSVWAGISSAQVMTQNSHGYIVVSKADNEITEQDVERALESSKSISTPLNYEILHVSPRSFSVDGQAGIKVPVGMTGVRLEVDTKIILGQSSQIKNLTRAIWRTGLQIDDLVLSILADSNLLLTGRQKDLGVVLVNLGGQTTSLTVYEEGDLLAVAVLPVGSVHITNDLAVGLRSPVEVMEKLKIQYGDCSAESLGRRGTVNLNELGSETHEVFKLSDVNAIIHARVEEIMYLIDKELKKIQRSGLLPAGVVFTGAGAKLAGLVDAAKRNLRLPATIGYPSGLISATDKINDPGFSTAIGLVKWGSDMFGYDKRLGNGWWSSLKNIFKFKHKIQKTISSLIP